MLFVYWEKYFPIERLWLDSHMAKNKPFKLSVESKKKGESQIIIYHLGGGTFDVSLLSIDDGSQCAVRSNTWKITPTS